MPRMSIHASHYKAETGKEVCSSRCGSDGRHVVEAPLVRDLLAYCVIHWWDSTSFKVIRSGGFKTNNCRDVRSDDAERLPSRSRSKLTRLITLAAKGEK